MKQVSLFLSILALAGVLTLGYFEFGGDCCGSKDEKCGSECAGSCGGDCKGSCDKGITAKGAIGGVVVFNMDKVLAEYGMSIDKQTAFEAKAKSAEQEILRRRSKIEADVKAFQEKIDKALITRSTAEIQGQKLQKDQDAFNAYAQQKQAELAEEQQVMVNNIGDAVKKFIDSYAAEKGYSMVLATQGDILPAPVVYASEVLDITDELVAALNAAYSAN